MAKRPFKRKIKRKRHGASFWDHEYTEGGHLKLSDEAAEDLKKFCRWLLRQHGNAYLNPTTQVADFGCGNGRNLVYLAETFGVHGVGYDVSAAAIKIAQSASTAYTLSYEARSIAGTFPAIPDESQSIVLDMMTSHFLSAAQRKTLKSELLRVLKPGGYLFMKTHLGDGDLHTKRLLAEAPAKEPQTYIHPVMGVPEHVYFEADLRDFLEPDFTIEKVYRSHKHISRGRARKRRTITVYARKPEF
ncbi:MAG TPA: class I SAM-dependent methyltransferase [Candidatus Paceibacterota bacterium]|nr:class I SAM-dependent methyltransferase [Candidatus Paceibacterota bacterium]